ncbi:MAG: UDP-N-acetylmuramate dehydrogenase [Bryobacteraceae bacterium]
MSAQEETLRHLAQIPNLQVLEHVPLSRYTRFGIGGPADVYAQTEDEATFIHALRLVRSSGLRYVVIGGGTNLVVSDAGFSGVVLRFKAHRIWTEGNSVHADAGAELQDLVDFAVERGLKGVETMTGIPGSVGAAIYGNAGAYGHSIMERVHSVRFFDGATVRVFGNAQCEFHYRESVFKRYKDWIVFSTELRMDAAQPEELRQVAGGILNTRNRKYPPSMKCAGSIFKNLIVAELPDRVQEMIPLNVIREGKAPSAYFLEQVGAKGLQNGDIHVADYHANLIYNAGRGTARELREVIEDLKRRVQGHFGLQLEEEVQYVGFGPDDTRAA